MAGKSTIEAKEVAVKEPIQQKERPITIHLGVFFGGDETIQGTWLASNYEIQENEGNRKYTLVFTNSIYPSLEELFEEDGMETFGNRVGEMLDEAFSRLHSILSGYFLQASNLTIEIDTFCVEEGFFCASMFCEAIEHGCFNELPPYAKYALNFCGGCGILEDLRMRGTKVTLNSFTTFQTMPDVAPQEDNPSLLKKKTNKDSTKDSKVKKVHSAPSSYDANQYKKGTEYITANEEMTSFKISVQKTRYEGLYSKLCNVEDWLENTALACDIVALSCAATGIGLAVGAACEVISMGLNGINFVVCFALAGMASVDGNTEARNEHLRDAGLNAIGTLPLGSIIGKTMKGAKFVTRKEPLKIVENTIEPVAKKSNVIPLHTNYLKPVESSTSNISRTASKTIETNKINARSRLKVIEFERKKVGNGEDIITTKVTSISNDVFLNSNGFVSVNNFCYLTLGGRRGIDFSHANQIKQRGGNVPVGKTPSQYPQKVEAIHKGQAIDFNLARFMDQVRAYMLIKFEQLHKGWMKKSGKKIPSEDSSSKKLDKMT